MVFFFKLNKKINEYLNYLISLDGNIASFFKRHLTDDFFEFIFYFSEIYSFLNWESRAENNRNLKKSLDELQEIKMCNYYYILKTIEIANYFLFPVLATHWNKAKRSS